MNVLIKNIPRTFDMEIKDSNEHNLLACATLFTNIFSESKILSSSSSRAVPSILRIPPSKITQEILSNHKAVMATRALQNAMRSRSPNAPQLHFFTKDDMIWAHYKLSDKTDSAQWAHATVETAEPHFVTARRPPQGRAMRIAYEDIL